MSESLPDHWMLLSGPANWFRLRHPPHWVSEIRDGMYALRPPDSEAMIAINTIWMNVANVIALPGLQEIVDQFPKVRDVQTVNEMHLDGVMECMQGEAVFDTPDGWWGRVWRADKWRAWKMWSFRSSQLLIVVSLLHEGPRDYELEAIMRMVLRGLELPDVPADPPEVFAERALALARRRFPLLKIDLAEDFQLKIEGSLLNLSNFYRIYLRETDRFEKILLPALTTAVQVQGWGVHGAAPPLEIVRDRLMPMLFPEETWRDKFGDILGEPWVAGLVVLYVVDESNSYWFVRNELLSQWGLTPSDLHEIAIDNLHSYFERQPMEMAVATTEQGQVSMMMPGKADSYNSVRLLCHSFLDRLREVAMGDLVIGVPGRDFFIATPTVLPSMVEKIRNRVQQDFRQTDHPLTDRLLLITADGVSEVVDDDDA